MIELASPGGVIVYRDTLDHFENGLLRLMRLSRDEFSRWLGFAETSGASGLSAKLGSGFARLRPPPSGIDAGDATVEAGPSGEPGTLLHPAISENPEYGVARATNGSIAWLGKLRDGRFERVTEPPAYDESYFEGGSSDGRGYGDYGAQAGWRLEKSRRQLREIVAATGKQAFDRALDVGSGYGFFRKALDEVGSRHDGIEISEHARKLTLEQYGFESMGGTLEDHVADLEAQYDLVTLWDVLEHVADPVGFLRLVARCLRAGGVAAMKTPNLDCPEAEIFGAHYHSFKREHLVYFSAASLSRCAKEAGLELVSITSVSHLLTGFVGPETCASWAAELRGADLVAYFRSA